MLPVFALVLTAVDATVRATVHDSRIVGMYRQGAYRTFAIDAVPDPQPGIAAIAAAPDALSQGAYTYGGLFRHGLFLSATMPCQTPTAAQPEYRFLLYSCKDSSPLPLAESFNGGEGLRPKSGHTDYPISTPTQSRQGPCS